VVWSKVFSEARATLTGSWLMIIHGELQRENGLTHLVAKELEGGSHDLQRLADGTLDADDDTPTSTKHRAITRQRHPRNARVLVPVSRDFH